MSTTTTKYGFIKPERSDNYSVDVMGNNMDKIEAALNNAKTTSITNSGTITSTGLITANGGVKGNLTGNVTGKVYVSGKTTTSKKNGDIQYATCAAQTLTFSGENTEKTLTVAGYSKISMSYPYQLAPGVYIPAKANFTDSVPSSFTRTITVKLTSSTSYYLQLYVNDEYIGFARYPVSGESYPITHTVNVGDVVKIKSTGKVYGSATVAAKSTYYINVV